MLQFIISTYSMAIKEIKKEDKSSNIAFSLEKEREREKVGDRKREMGRMERGS